MSTDRHKSTPRDSVAILVILAGAAVATLATLENHIAWIAAFCGFLGDGCRDTAQYQLLGFPIALWGMIFYAALGLLFLRQRRFVFWAVMIGVGSEVVFARIMIEQQLACVFCLANLLIMSILLLCLFNIKRFWQMIAMIAMSYIVTGLLISGGTKVAPTSVSPDTPVAIVGDRTITTQQIERPLTSELFKRRQEIFKLKQMVVQTQIDQTLLELEAESRNISVDALIDQIRSQIAPPADHVIEHYFESQLYLQWGAWTGTPDQIKEKIRDYLVTRQSNPLLVAFCQKLREKYPVTLLLQEPHLPATKLSINNAPTLGPVNAPVMVMELSDYHCPVCRKSHQVVKAIREKYKDQIRWVYKDYPLKKHPLARPLAMAARYAQTQGKFWEFQELLWSAEHPPTLADANTFAQQLGLDVDAMKQYMADPQAQAALEKDVDQILDAGLASTPTFIINGYLHSGKPTLEEFTHLIEKAIQEATRTTSTR